MMAKTLRSLAGVTAIGASLLALSACHDEGAATSDAQLSAAEVAGTVVLGRPTAQQIAVSVVPTETIEAYFEAGSAPAASEKRTPAAVHPAGEPFVVTIDGLKPDTRYSYRMLWRRPGDGSFVRAAERTFHTQRARGATFTFTIQADSHLDENSDLDLYRRTLANVLADAPDLHVDLGDTFMCEKHSAALTATVQTAPDAATVNARYLYERGNFGLLAHSVPLFLVNGNHEGELGFLLKGAGQDLAVWAASARLRFFLNPTPDGFYLGDSVEEPFVGRRASWYAWEWGDALFVVLDPFWYTKTKSSTDGWVWTLGERQYRWLAQTLAASSATFKLVFCHSLVGGLDGQERGGIEAAPFFEWGGRDLDGGFAFDQKRPGWGKPIHQLLVENGVTAFFHGHDHLYARQELDGVAYQEVPQPSARSFASGPNLAAAYHYASGTIRSSSGHLRVTVAPDRVTVQYVRAYLPRDENAERRNGEIDDTWVAGDRE
jgi:hypothetical protein